MSLKIPTITPALLNKVAQNKPVTTITRKPTTTLSTAIPRIDPALAAAQRAATDLISRIKNFSPTSWESLRQQFPSFPLPPGINQLPFSHQNLATVLHAYYSNTAQRVKEFKASLTNSTSQPQRFDHHEVTIKGFTLRPQQRKAVDNLIDNLRNADQSRATLLCMGTGKGKTIVGAAIAQWIKTHVTDNPNTPLFPHAPIKLNPPILWLTRKPVVLSTRAKLARAGLSEKDVLVLNYEALSTQPFKNWFDDTTEVIYGNPTPLFKWKGFPFQYVICDETQALKKIESTKTKRVLGLAMGMNGDKTRWLLMSATPAVAPNDLMLFGILSHLNTPHGRLDRTTWPAFIRGICGRTDPTTPNAEAMKRLKTQFGQFISIPPNDPSRIKAYNKITMLEFQSDKERDAYTVAQQEYEDAIRATGRTVTSDVRARRMLALGVFRRKEEQIKAHRFAQRALEKHAAGFAPVVGVCYVDTVIDIVGILHKAGVPREKISIIYGGRKIIKDTEVFSANELRDILQQADESTSDFNLKYHFLDRKAKAKLRKTFTYIKDRMFRGESHAEQKERNTGLEHLRLNRQNPRDRQTEIDRFLNGETEYCIFTFSAGGVGLDLDQQFPHVRPRDVDVTICYYAEEFVQALGRCLRLSTLSDVNQNMLFYKDTVPAYHVAPKLAKKISSINSLMTTGVDFAALMEEEVADRVLNEVNTSTTLTTDVTYEAAECDEIANDEELDEVAGIEEDDEEGEE